MYTTIAVGTDGSASADEAVTAAIDLAERYGAELVALSAYEGRDALARSASFAAAAMAPAPIDVEWATQAAERVEGVLGRVRQRALERGVRCRTEAAEGDPARVLIELAERNAADVLVIGNRGMQRRILGSVPNTVAHKAPCSVLVVKTT